VNYACIAVSIIAIGAMLSSGRERPDAVAGNLLQFNENGAWLPSSDRVVFDGEKNRLLAGSIACSLGIDGAQRAGNIEVTLSDLAAGTVEQFILHEGDQDTFRCDIRNAPGIIMGPDSSYVAMYTFFFTAACSYYHRAANNFRPTWGDEQRFDWLARGNAVPNPAVAYANLCYLVAEQRMYNFVAGNDGGLHIMVSRDSGSTWTYGGCLLKSGENGAPADSIRFRCSGSADRIDIICTGYCSQDATIAMYHGYIRNGALHTSSGVVADKSIFDTLATPAVNQLTKIFPRDALPAGSAVRRCRDFDVRRYNDDTVVAAAALRIIENEGADTDDYLIYCRFDGKEWIAIRLAKGSKADAEGKEYKASAALDPHDENALYISSAGDPRNGSPLGGYELFKGITRDQGATWEWVPITSRSDRDNLYPVVPAGNEINTALL